MFSLDISKNDNAITPFNLNEMDFVVVEII